MHEEFFSTVAVAGLCGPCRLCLWPCALWKPWKPETSRGVRELMFDCFHHVPSFPIIFHNFPCLIVSIIGNNFPSCPIIFHNFPSFPFLFHQSHLLLPGCLAQSDNYLTRLYLTSDFKASIPKTERITLRSTMTPQTEHMQILVASSCYCFASVGMLLFNKFAVQDFPLEPGGVNGYMTI